MAGLLGNIGGLLGGNITSMAAKGIASGLVKGFSAKWTIEGFRDAAENDYDLNHLFTASPQWSATLSGAFQKYSELRDVSANELLSWIQKGNPVLFREICEEPAVVAWLFKAWEIGKKELATAPNLDT